MTSKVKTKGRSLPVLANGRSCGPCHSCCINLDVDDPGIAHARGTRCPRLTDDNKCGDYDGRPATCREFSCLWLLGFGGAKDRPDKTGVIFHLMPEMTVPVPDHGDVAVVPVAANETRAGVVDDENSRAAQAIKAMAFQVPVIVTRVDGSRAVKVPVGAASKPG